MHGGSGTNARPPWTLVATPDGLGCYPEHERAREPRERHQTRPVRPAAASALVKRGVITRAIALATSGRLARFLRRIEREGAVVERELAAEGVDVVAYRIRVTPIEDRR